MKKFVFLVLLIGMNLQLLKADICKETKFGSAIWRICKFKKVSSLEKDIQELKEYVENNIRKKDINLLNEFNKSIESCDKKTCHILNIYKYIDFISNMNVDKDFKWWYTFKIDNLTTSNITWKVLQNGTYLCRVKDSKHNSYHVLNLKYGNVFEMNTKTSNVFFEYLDSKNKKFKQKFFSDGTYIGTGLKVNSGAKCDSLLGETASFALKDKDHNILQEKLLFILLDKPKEIHGNNCETSDFISMIKKVDVIFPSVFMQSDDTFLTPVNINRKGLIRFDKRFSSKSNLVDKKLFWMDKKEYNILKQKYNIKTLKDENKMIYTWIQTKLKGK
jgi:hypothetical protein